MQWNIYKWQSKLVRASSEHSAHRGRSSLGTYWQREADIRADCRIYSMCKFSWWHPCFILKPCIISFLRPQFNILIVYSHILRQDLTEPRLALNSAVQLRMASILEPSVPHFSGVEICRHALSALSWHIISVGVNKLMRCGMAQLLRPVVG